MGRQLPAVSLAGGSTAARCFPDKWVGSCQRFPWQGGQQLPVVYLTGGSAAASCLPDWWIGSCQLFGKVDDRAGEVEVSGHSVQRPETKFTSQLSSHVKSKKALSWQCTERRSSAARQIIIFSVFLMVELVSCLCTVHASLIVLLKTTCPVRFFCSFWSGRTWACLVGMKPQQNGGSACEAMRVFDRTWWARLKMPSRVR